MESTIQKCLSEVNSCAKCAGICDAIGPYGTDIGFNYIKPIIPVEILFIAESPPPQKDNFFYNESAKNKSFRTRLFNLINLAGLKSVNSIEEFNLRGYYLVDAINCRWNKNRKKAKQPTDKLLRKIISNCIPFMMIQLELLKPKSIVFMGKAAQKARENEAIITTISKLDRFNTRIIEIPFIQTAPVKTEFFIEQLSVLKGLGRDF